MGRSRRPWHPALAASVLLHGALLTLGMGMPWRWHAADDAPVLEARLVAAVEAPIPIRPSPRPLPRRSVRPPPRPAAPPQTPAEPPPAPVTEPFAAPASAAGAATEMRPVDAEPALAAAPAAPTAAETAAETAAPPPATPRLNPLPRRLTLRYEVHYGLASGEQTLVWVDEGEHYTLTSAAAATGMTGLFYRGRFVQTSRGRITPQGLQPEEFWDQRGSRYSSARFDAAHGDLVLMPQKGEPRHFSYQGEAPQDALSVFFQFALTAPPPAGPLTYTVFNGKKLRSYHYTVGSEEPLDTALGTLRTLRLTRVADGDGRFEAWLAIDRHYLPVRVVRSDEQGNEVELRVKSLSP